MWLKEKYPLSAIYTCIMLRSFLGHMSFHVHSNLVCPCVTEKFLLMVHRFGGFLSVFAPYLKCTFKAGGDCHCTANLPVMWTFGYFTPSDAHSRCFYCLTKAPKDYFIFQLSSPACLPGWDCRLKISIDILRIGRHFQAESSWLQAVSSWSNQTFQLCP